MDLANVIVKIFICKNRDYLRILFLLRYTWKDSVAANEN